MRRYVGVALVILVVLTLATAVSAQPKANPVRPWIVGVVTAVADNGQTLTVTTPQQPAAPVTVKADANTKLFETVDMPIGQLQNGDVIAVNGMPLKIHATSVQASGDFQQLMGQALGRTVPAKPKPQGASMVLGPVVSLNPLQVSVGGVQVEVVTDAKTLVVKFQPLADVTALKADAKVIAVGQRQDATLTATMVILDSTATGIGRITGFGPYVRKSGAKQGTGEGGTKPGVEQGTGEDGTKPTEPAQTQPNM